MVVTSLLARKESVLIRQTVHYLNEVGIVRQGCGEKKKGRRREKSEGDALAIFLLYMKLTSFNVSVRVPKSMKKG